MALIDEITSYWNSRAEGYSQDVALELQNDHQGTLVMLNYLLTKHGLLTLHKAPSAVSTMQALPLTSYRALDLGCGPALLSIHLAKLGCSVTAIDNSTSMLQRAQELSMQQLSPEELARITFKQGNAMELEVTNNSYDLVVSRDMFWILSDPLKAYRHALQVLKAHGLMVVFDGNYYYGYADSAYQKDYSINHKHLQNVDVNVIARLAQDLPLSYQMRPHYDFTLLQQVVAQESLSLHFTAYLHHEWTSLDTVPSSTNANNFTTDATSVATLAAHSWTVLYDSPVLKDTILPITADNNATAHGDLIEKFVIVIHKE